MKPIISRLRKLNIEISLVAGKLRIHAPEGVLTGELLEEIKASKDYLIEYILEVRGNRPDTGIPPAEKKRYFRLTSAQRRLYTLYAMDRDSLAYNETQVIRLDGDFQEDKLRRVFRQLVQRHESLRTYFELVENEPVQRIAGAIEPAIGFLEGEESWLDRIIASFIRPFDLHRAPLFRAGLVTTSAGGHFLIVDTHHIITDAFSEGILIRDFRTLWKGESLDPLPLQYKDYAEWQGHMHRMKGIGQREFWLREFAGEPKPPELPADFPRPAVKGRTTGVLHFELQAAETAALRDIGRESGASLFMILLSIYTILLAKLSGQEDIVVGIPMADRQHAGLEGVMGLFINTLALRNYPRGDKGYLEFLSDLRTRTLACLDHPYYPYEDIIDDLRIARTTGRNPLFDVWFIYQNYEKAGQDGHGIVLLESRRAERESKFDIILEASDPGSQIFLTIVYSGDLFRQSTMERFAGYFR
ncbi:MAG TPA: condensation domain-containing protein, partial [Puia sp.]|nr:condensation domain-containing protein [Puia sp.]